MRINQTSLPFHKLSIKEDVTEVLEIWKLIFLKRDLYRAVHKPGYCSIKNSWKLIWKKTDLFWVLRSKPNRVLGLPVLIWAPDLYWDQQEWTVGPMLMCSLDSSSAPGYLHSVGIATQKVSVPFGFGVFSKPPLRPDTSRNRKYNQHSPEVYNCPCWVVMPLVMIILSFSRSDPWLWEASPQHEISWVLVDLQLFELEVESLIWSELLFSFICSCCQNCAKAHKFLHDIHGHGQGTCYLLEP